TTEAQGLLLALGRGEVLEVAPRARDLVVEAAADGEVGFHGAGEPGVGRVEAVREVGLDAVIVFLVAGVDERDALAAALAEVAVCERAINQRLAAGGD